MRYLTLFLLAAVAAGCTVQAPTTNTPQAPTFINVTEPWPYPFSSVVRAGDFLFLSGQIGSTVVDGAPKIVSGGIDAETRHETPKAAPDVKREARIEQLPWRPAPQLARRAPCVEGGLSRPCRNPAACASATPSAT